MAIMTTRCPVIGAHVTRVTDFEGNVTRIICSEYDASRGTCRAKRTASDGGPLSQLLLRTAEDTLNQRGIACDLARR